MKYIYFPPGLTENNVLNLILDIILLNSRVRAIHALYLISGTRIYPKLR